MELGGFHLPLFLLVPKSKAGVLPLTSGVTRTIRAAALGGTSGPPRAQEGGQGAPSAATAAVVITISNSAGELRVISLR